MAFWNRPSGNFETAQVAMNSSSGTKIIDAGQGRVGCILKNTGTTGEIVYLGKSAALATSTTGFPLGPGESIPIQSRAAVYGRSATGTPKVAVIITSGAKVAALNE